MKRYLIHSIIVIGGILVSIMSCKKDVPQFENRSPVSIYDTAIVYDSTFFYDTVEVQHTSIVYDSSLIMAARKNWIVIDSSSATGEVKSKTENLGDRTVHDLFDSSKSTYYHSGWIRSPKTLFDVPHWFIVDMTRPQKVERFFYIGRSGGPTDHSQTPKTINIFASNDLSKLTSFDASDNSATIIVEKEGLPDYDEQIKQDTIWIDNGNTGNQIDSFRYFRFVITENYNNGSISNFSELGTRLLSAPNPGVQKITTDTLLIPKDTIITAIDTVITRIH